MLVNETIRRIGTKLRQQTDEVTKAPLPTRMRELLAMLERLEQQMRAGRPPKPCRQA